MTTPSHIFTSDSTEIRNFIIRIPGYGHPSF